MRRIYYLWKNDLRDWPLRGMWRFLCYGLLLAILSMLLTVFRIPGFAANRFLQHCSFYGCGFSDEFREQAAHLTFYSCEAFTSDCVDQEPVVYEHWSGITLFQWDDSGTDPEQTFFTQKNLRGCNPAALEKGAILLSQNAAYTLAVRKGDMIYLILEPESDEEEEEEDSTVYLPLRVVGIYAAQDMGEDANLDTCSGILSAEEDLSCIAYQKGYFSFARDKETYDQLEKADFEMQTRQKAMEANTYPMGGAALAIHGLVGIILALIVGWEMSRSVKRGMKTCEVYAAMGGGTGDYILGIMAGDFLIWLLTVAGAMIFYREVLLRLYFARSIFAPGAYMFLLGAILLGIILLALLFTGGLYRKKLKQVYVRIFADEERI